MGAVSDVQTYLAAQSVVDGATGWTSVRRRMHDQADKLVVISEDGGPTPRVPAHTGVGSGALRDSGVQIIVRAEPWQGDDSLDKAQAIYDELQGLRDQALGGTTYLRIRAMTPEPVFLGFDESGRPSHSIAFRLMHNHTWTEFGSGFGAAFAGGA